MKKYLIDSILSRFNNDTRNLIIDEIIKALGMHSKTFKSKLYADIGSSSVFSSDDLLIIRKVLQNHDIDVNLDQLVTLPVEA